MGNKSEKMMGGPSAPMKIGPFNPLGDHETVSLSDATAFSPIKPKGAWQLIIQAQTQNVMYRLEGVPTSSIGFLLTAGDPKITITIGSNSTPHFIAAVAGAVLQYQWGE